MTPATPACGDRQGTRVGYRRHRRTGELPCDPCRAAVRDYARAYRQAMSPEKAIALRAYNAQKMRTYRAQRRAAQ